MASEPRLARDRVTLADVAAAAGVSVPTVSKVLNGHADVAPKARSRVEALLADYNYAAPRRTGRPCLIDLVFADLSPWAVEIIRGAEEAASAEGCRIAVSVVSGEPDTEQWLTRLSVVGFDDLPMSGWVSPPLTTIVQPLAQMAAMATRTILALLDGRADTSSNRVELTTLLVVRASTAPPRKRAAGREAASAGPVGTRSSRRGREVRSG